MQRKIWGKNSQGKTGNGAQEFNSFCGPIIMQTQFLHCCKYKNGVKENNFSVKYEMFVSMYTDTHQCAVFLNAQQDILSNQHVSFNISEPCECSVRHYMQSAYSLVAMGCESFGA